MEAWQTYTRHLTWPLERLERRAGGVLRPDEKSRLCLVRNICNSKGKVGLNSVTISDSTARFSPQAELKILLTVFLCKTAFKYVFGNLFEI